MSLNPAIKDVAELIPFAGKHEAEVVKKRYADSGKLTLRDKLTVDATSTDLWQQEKQPRAVGRLTHGWMFLRGFYTNFEVFDLQQKNDVVILVESLLAEWMKIPKPESSMAYHDETTAQRVMNLVAFGDAAADVLSASGKEMFTSVIETDLIMLESPEFYAGINNHGMFQDFAILVAATYGYGKRTRQEYYDVAFGRLTKYFSSCFTADGVHIENSPSYHLMVSRYLRKTLSVAERLGYRDRFDSFENILRGADEYAAFAITPIGSFVPISDTAPNIITISQALDAYGEGCLTEVIRGEGEPSNPDDWSKVWEKSGYAVATSHHARRRDQNYLFFSCSYNADYHKHADENCLYYFAHGREILREAGPNGYEYSDPFTKYAYSSFAHNSLVVDGKSLPRIDAKASKTFLKSFEIDNDILKVCGVTSRYSGVQWKRTIETRRADDVELFSVDDSIESLDAHAYRFYWHLGEGLSTHIIDSEVFILAQDQTVVCVMTYSSGEKVQVRTVSGQESPFVLGWQFPKMGRGVKSTVIEATIRAKNFDISWQFDTRPEILTATNKRL